MAAFAILTCKPRTVYRGRMQARSRSFRIASLCSSCYPPVAFWKSPCRKQTYYSPCGERLSPQGQFLKAGLARAFPVFFWGSTGLLARRDQTEVGTLSGGAMPPLSSPLQAGIRFLRPPLPALLSPLLAGRLPSRLRTQEEYGLTVLRRCDTNGLGSTSPPATFMAAHSQYKGE